MSSKGAEPFKGAKSFNVFLSLTSAQLIVETLVATMGRNNVKLKLKSRKKHGGIHQRMARRAEAEKAASVQSAVGAWGVPCFEKI